MPLPSDHRWILVGSLVIRNRKNASGSPPPFCLSDVIDAVRKRIDDDNYVHLYGKDESQIMWFSDLDESTHYYRLLVSVADQNTSGVSFYHYKTRITRDIPKKEDEGGLYSAHIIIRKDPDPNGNYLLLAEKVPGAYLSALANHFGWVCRDSYCAKEYSDPKGASKTAYPVFELNGYCSLTIRDALSNGTLQDIEFVRYDENHDDGFDEDPIIKEKVSQAKYKIGQFVTPEQANHLFGRIASYFRDFKSDDRNAQLFVRIKTDEGQTRQTEVDIDSGSILEQAFIRNERVSGFAVPLPQRYDGLRSDMLSKMTSIAEHIKVEA